MTIQNDNKNTDVTSSNSALEHEDRQKEIVRKGGDDSCKPNLSTIKEVDKASYEEDVDHDLTIEKSDDGS